MYKHYVNNSNFLVIFQKWTFFLYYYFWLYDISKAWEKKTWNTSVMFLMYQNNDIYLFKITDTRTLDSLHFLYFSTNCRIQTLVGQRLIGFNSLFWQLLGVWLSIHVLLIIHHFKFYGSQLRILMQFDL